MRQRDAPAKSKVAVNASSTSRKKSSFSPSSSPMVLLLSPGQKRRNRATAAASSSSSSSPSAYAGTESSLRPPCTPWQHCELSGMQWILASTEQMSQGARLHAGPRPAGDKQKRCC